MSATVSTPVIAVEVAELNLSPKDLEKKVRVPTTLPAKYGKFIQFGYFMMNKLNACDGDEDTPPLIDEQVFLNKMRIFEPLEDQQAFVEEFLESSKQINDELRKMMLQRKRDIAKAAKEADKPKKSGGPKVPPETPSSKNKKSGKTKKTTTDEAVDNTDPTQPVVKKTRAKKVKVTSTEDALVNELVQLAEGSGEPTSSFANPPDLAAPVPSLSAKKESAEGTNGSPLPPPSKKESAKAAVTKLIAEVPKIADPVKETKAKVAKETKPKEDKPKVAKEEKSKVVKETKPKAAKESKPTVVEEKPIVKEGVSGGTIGSPEEEEELQVSIFMYEGQQYLIDDLNNVYDFTSQDKIGSLINDIIVKST